MFRVSTIALSVAGGFLCFSSGVIAQEDAPETVVPVSQAGKSQNEVYLPEYFERFAPNTARDMLGDIPGFTLRRDDGKRGLGQGGTNVIINGARVSGKQTDPLDILSRTPASNVVRIEIVDAASLGIPGLNGKVANFIIDNSKISGSWEWRPRFRTGLKPDWFNGKVSVSGERDTLSYTLSLDNTDAFKGGGTGPEFVYDNDGNLIETRQEIGQFYGENPTLSSNLTWNRNNGDVGNFNAQFALFEFDGSEVSFRTPEDQLIAPTVREFQRSEDEWNAEISGDYTMDFLNGKLKLIGIQYFESSPFVSNVVSREDGQPDTGSRFERVADEGESILRAEYSWSPQEGRTWELATEGVFNFLEIDDFLEIRDQFGVLALAEDSISSSRVEEKRFETTLSYNRPVGDKLDVQASLGIEYSEISQMGNFSRFVTDPLTNTDVLTPFTTEQERKFTRPKGFISAAYKKSDSMDIRFKVEREVGQLNFFDFIGSVNLETDIDRSGNPDLVPQQSWNSEIEFEKRFDNESKVTFRLFSEQIEDIVDTIPLELPGADLSDPNRDRGEGPGNIEKAERYGAELNSTIRLDDFGVEGGEFEIELFAQETKVEDPLTGGERKLSGATEWAGNIRFSHDIPNTDFAYGFFIDHFQDSPSFGLRQVSQFQMTDPFTGVFFEDKDFFGVNFKVNVFNLANTGEKLERTFFDRFRDSNNAIATTEVREQRFDQILRITISDTF